MNNNHVVVGIALLVLTIGFLCVRYLRARKVAPIAFWGWGGMAIILAAEALLILRVDWVTTFFTAIVWTGYLLLSDGLVWSLRGESRLTRGPAQFGALAFWSIPLWLIFEAYNLRLHNWTYVGLPQSQLVCDFGYVWAFATIWPAIFETADLVSALGLFRSNERSASRAGLLQARQQAGGNHRSLTNAALLRLLVSGLVLVTVPVLLPERVGSYLFGAVWIGFFPLLDPLNYFWKGRSLLREFENGEKSTLYSFLAAGWVCGILWEFWNFWASARWLYVFPIFQRWKIFEMPVLGYLGFPPFAVECFAMYEFLRTVKNQLLGFRREHDHEWKAESLHD